MHEATLTSKCQITLPKAVRDALGLAPGDKLQFVPAWVGYNLVVIKRDIKPLDGLFKGRRASPLSIGEMNEVISQIGSRGEADTTPPSRQRRTSRSKASRA